MGPTRLELSSHGELWRIAPAFANEIALKLDEEIPPFALLQARRRIEPETAALAALNADTVDLAALRDALARNIEDNRVPEDGHRFVDDRLLHIHVAEASNNAAYALLIKHLLDHQYGVMFRRLQFYYMEN